MTKMLTLMVISSLGISDSYFFFLRTSLLYFLKKINMLSLIFKGNYWELKKEVKWKSGINPTIVNALKIKKRKKIPKDTAEEAAVLATDRHASILQSMVSPTHLLPNCETKCWSQSPSLLLVITEANPAKPALETAEGARLSETHSELYYFIVR